MTAKKCSGGCYDEKKPSSMLSATLIQESGSVDWQVLDNHKKSDAFTLVLYVLGIYQSFP